MDIRSELLKALKEEIVGPVENPKYKDETTGEEILLRSVHGSPKSRYGAGMLYPKSSTNMGEADTDKTEPNSEEIESSDKTDHKTTISAKSRAKGEDLSYEEPVGLANQFLPSAMGFTVQFDKKESDGSIEIDCFSACYKKGTDQQAKKRINKEGRIETVNNDGAPILSDYWIRSPLKVPSKIFNIYSLFQNGEKRKKEILAYTESGEPWISLNIYNRSVKTETSLTFTFVLVNEVKATGERSKDDRHILYQNKLILRTKNHNLIIPYKERTRLSDTDEEKELNLLYRNKRVFGIGHGVSVEWSSISGEEREKITEIKTSVIPRYEMPQIAPTSLVTLSMHDLSDLGDWDTAKLSLNELVSKYEQWIHEIETESKKLNESYQVAAVNSVKKCQRTLARIKRGVEYLMKEDESSDLVKSFRWMNKAMLWQQQRSGTQQRIWKRTWDKSNQPVDILDSIDSAGKQEFESLEDFKESERWGKWRPFQLAFVLMNIESIVNPESKEREIVDLIWFPTGGGKTEAYLGLSAFTIFYRRLCGEREFEHEKYSGTTILMRYTLRLLTTQQYERAASLICACELIRLEEEKKGNFILGDEPISIGLWVGGSSTPNKNATAVNDYNQLNDHRNYKNAPYNFVVMKCPCCAAQIGKVKNAKYKDSLKIKGLHKEDGSKASLKFRCENENCEFYERDLPLYVIDEIIY